MDHFKRTLLSIMAAGSLFVAGAQAANAQTVTKTPVKTVKVAKKANVKKANKKAVSTKNKKAVKKTAKKQVKKNAKKQVKAIKIKKIKPVKKINIKKVNLKANTKKHKKVVKKAAKKNIKKVVVKSATRVVNKKNAKKLTGRKYNVKSVIIAPTSQNAKNITKLINKVAKKAKAKKRVRYYNNLSRSEKSARSWIVWHESRGLYTARNGRYYGAYQLDRAYLRGNFSKANQDKTAYRYVMGRYGSWKNAKRHWLSYGWY